MMGAWSRSNPKPAFDAETFKKLVARFDSNHAGEAETAFRKAMLMCAQSSLRFCDAATDAYGGNGQTSELEAELGSLRELLDQRERQGAALAEARDRLEQEFASYRRRTEQELAQARRTNGPGIGTYCRGCEWKRAVLAVCIGIPIAKLWFSEGSISALQSIRGDTFQNNTLGWSLAASPAVAVLLRWWWLAFKRKHAWVSARDNNIYRRIKARWNRFVQRLILS